MFHLIKLRVRNKYLETHLTPNLVMTGEISVNFPTDSQLDNAQGKMQLNVHCSFRFCKHDLHEKWKTGLKLKR